MKTQATRRNAILGLTSALSLAVLAFGLATLPKFAAMEGHRRASRGLAAAFGQFANQPSSVNVASILNTFQTPNSVLPINNVVSQIQSQMLSGIPAGTPIWDGHGPLPGAVGTAGFNPTFSFDYSGCSMIPMNFSSVYSATVNLPTVWCGAVSQGQAKAPSIPDSLNAGNTDNQPRAIQFTGNHVAI